MLFVGLKPKTVYKVGAYNQDQQANHKGIESIFKTATLLWLDWEHRQPTDQKKKLSSS